MAYLDLGLFDILGTYLIIVTYNGVGIVSLG